MSGFNQNIINFVNNEKWTYAKTMPEWPHEYIVREKVNEKLFLDIVLHIREFGYSGKFYSKTMTYFDQDGFSYWTMGAPIEETMILNRTQKENTYEQRLKNGTLPKIKNL